MSTQFTCSSFSLLQCLPCPPSQMYGSLFFNNYYIFVYKFNMVSPLSLVCVFIYLGLTIWDWIADKRPLLWSKLTSSLSAVIGYLYLLTRGVRACELPPSILLCQLLWSIQSLYRQPYCCNLTSTASLSYIEYTTSLFVQLNFFFLLKIDFFKQHLLDMVPSPPVPPRSSPSPYPPVLLHTQALFMCSKGSCQQHNSQVEGGPDIYQDYSGVLRGSLVDAEDHVEQGAGRRSGEQTGSVKYDILLINCPPIAVTRLPEESVLSRS